MNNKGKRGIYSGTMFYDNYIFDLYGTLIDIHTDEKSPALWDYMAEYLLMHFNVSYTAAKLKEDYLRICGLETDKLALKSGSLYSEIKIEWVWQRIIGENCTEDEMRNLCIAFREKSRDKFACYDSVHDCLARIKGEGKKVYLLSNAQRLFTEKELEDADLIKYFDDVFISSDHGCKKPDKAFIEALISKYSMDKSKTVMVGNEITADVGSAAAAGVHAIYLNTYNHSEMEIAADLEQIGRPLSYIKLSQIKELSQSAGAGGL